MTCRPFACVYDRNDLDFNEVFLTDVVVPAENLVGPLGGGWKVANGSLGHERTMMWLQFANRLGRRSRAIAPSVRYSATSTRRIAMDYQALRLLGSAALAKAARGEGDTAGLSVLKVFGSEAEQNAYRHVLEATGADGLADPAMTAPYNPYSPGQFTAGWFTRYIGSFAGTIAGGTSEIQRNIIAQRVVAVYAVLADFVSGPVIVSNVCSIWMSPALVEEISRLERVKSAAAAGQARAAAALDELRRAAEAAAGVPRARQGRGVASEVALARRDSPARGGRHLGFAKALVHEMPHTLAALECGALSEWRATLIVRESACLDVEDRRHAGRRTVRRHRASSTAKVISGSPPRPRRSRIGSIRKRWWTGRPRPSPTAR